MLESNQMHPPDHIVCDYNKLQPTRRRKKKKEQQQQQQVLGKASKILPSSFLPSSDGLADRKQRQKHGLRRPQFRTQNTKRRPPFHTQNHHKQCLNFLLVQEDS
jgi:hypothetical protein